MAKCAIFVTTDQQADSAAAVLRERGSDIPIYSTHPLRVADEAMGIVRREGIQVIIARGAVALEFRKCTSLPVVDIIMTVQELGMLLVEAKSRLGLSHPTIAVVTQKNMFGDMSDVDVLFGVKLRLYYVSSLSELSTATRRAANDGADLAIGGIYVKATCEELGLPYMSLTGGRSSVRNALQTADQIAYTIDLQERSNAERSALLNFSFNGIIKLDKDGCVVTMNQRAESLLDLTPAEAEGRHISDILPAVDRERLKKEVLLSGDELFCTFWADDEAIAVSIAPVEDGNGARSAILSCYEIERMSSFEREARSSLGRGISADPQLSYKWLSSMAEEHAPFVRTMNDAAQYDDSILFCGGGAAERSYCAAFIHVNSLRRDLPFVELSAASYAPEEQADILFGSADSPGAIASANGGTLFLDEAESLTPQCQQRLAHLLRSGKLICRGAFLPVDIRVIAGSGVSLRRLCAEGRFRGDLFHALGARSLRIPPLAGCPNAIVRWSMYYLERCCAPYGRFNVFTKSARRLIGAQPWEGGHSELQYFCRLCAAEATRRSLDEAAVTRILNSMYDEPEQPQPAPDPGSREKDRIVYLMEKYGGNRTLLAAEMQISKTTLWRRMKHFGLI